MPTTSTAPVRDMTRPWQGRRRAAARRRLEAAVADVLGLGGMIAPDGTVTFPGEEKYATR